YHGGQVSSVAAMSRYIFTLGTVNKTIRRDGSNVGTETRLTVDCRLLWIDQGHIDAADDAVRRGVSGLAGFPVQGVLWCFGPALDAERHENLTRMLPWEDTLRGAVTMIPYRSRQALHLVRCIGIHMEEVRDKMAQAWAYLRLHVLDTPVHMPRLWAT